eukprot:2507209-Pleurochrysis_carterae.AAC.1
MAMQTGLRAWAGVFPFRAPSFSFFPPPSLTHTLTLPLLSACSRVCSPYIHLITHSLTHSLAHSLARSLTYSLTPSVLHPLFTLTYLLTLAHTRQGCLEAGARGQARRRSGAAGDGDDCHLGTGTTQAGAGVRAGGGVACRGPAPDPIRSGRLVYQAPALLSRHPASAHSRS